MTIKKIKVGSTTHDIRADSADKLNTNAGSATSPVYFANGVPVECTYDLNKTVPSNAVFTDTKVTSSANNGTKIYFTGTSNSAGETNTQLLNTGIFADCETGYLHLTNLLHVGGDTNWSKFFHNGTDTIITNGSGTGVLKLTSGGVLSLSTNSGSSFRQVATLDGSEALTNKTYNGYTLAAACAKGVTDSTAAGAIGTGSNLVTERDVYYGLPKINGLHNYTSSTSIYAPTAGGTSGYVLIGNGTTSAPVWKTLANANIAAKGHTHSYLPLSGGTMTGSIVFSDDYGFTQLSRDAGTFSIATFNGGAGSNIYLYDGTISINDNFEIDSSGRPIVSNGASYRLYDNTGTAKSGMWLSSTNNLHLGNYETTGHGGDTYINSYYGNIHIRNSGRGIIYLTDSNNIGFFRPSATNVNCLGGSSYRWQTIYAKNALNTSSDYYQKENIQEMPQKYIDMLDDIEPVIFKFKDGDRLHGGYISQWIEESMEKHDIAAEEFGGFCKDPKLDENEEAIEGEYEYSLRYSEFIPIIHAKMKQLNKEYKEEINKLKEEINELKLLINQ